MTRPLPIAQAQFFTAFLPSLTLLARIDIGIAVRVRFLAVLMVLGYACTRPLPGVLTLAPAGMRTTGSCISHPDGTLSMGADSAAESTVYVDSGGVTIAVTAKPSTTTVPVIELWLDGILVGSRNVQPTQEEPLRFHAQARTSGPKPLRIDIPALAATANPVDTVVDLVKVVITEP